MLLAFACLCTSVLRARCFATEDPVGAIRTQTSGRGVDVAIEALGIQTTFENALRALKPGGVLWSVGVYSGHLRIPLDAFGAGLADQTIVTTLCPGGKERMRRPHPTCRSRPNQS